jgi:hypothetical protein
MNLSRPVNLTFTGVIPSKTYTLLTSEDGINWSRHSTPQVTTTASGTVTFSTDHFSLFALAEEPPTPLCNLTINPTPIANGSQATFAWTTLNASGVTINNGIGNVAGYGVQSGSLLAIPPTSASTEYTMTATNPYGSTSCKATVVTKALPVCTITSSTSNIKNGRNVVLSWTGTNAETGSLTPNNITVPSVGNITTVPPTNTSTNYALSLGNDVGTTSCNTIVTTYANTAPVAQDDAVGTIQNVDGFFPVLTNDGDSNTGDTITIKDVVSQPAHGTAEVAGSQIHYTPTPAYCGSDSFTYRVQDEDGAPSSPATVNINISCGTNAPVVDTMTFSGTEDTLLSGTLSGSDVDNDPIQYTLLTTTLSGTVIATGNTQAIGMSGSTTFYQTTIPTLHGSVTLTTTGAFSYTPSADFNGTDSFLYTATDGYYSGNTATVTLSLTPVNDTPTAVADSGSTNKNVTTALHLLANDIDPDHSIPERTITITTSPTQGTVTLSGMTNASGTSLGTVALYTPSLDVCGVQDTFNYRVTDGSGATSNIASVTVDVVCTNDPPTAVADTLTLSEDTTGTLSALTNDTDPNILPGSNYITGELLRIDSITTSPTSGTATILQNATPSVMNTNISSDTISYTPAPNFCGTDMFSYRTRDSSGSTSNNAMVMVTINCTNDAPTTQSLTLSGVVNPESSTLLTLSGLLSVTDIDNTTGFVYTLTTTPLFGTASIQNTTGLFSYTPNTLGFTGTETLPFTVMDASGATSPVRYITVLYTPAPKIISFSGITTTSTGQVSLLSGSTKTSLTPGYTLDLTGRTITAISRPSDLGFSGTATISGTNLLPGSIVIPGSTKITVDGGIWSGEILAPTKVASNQTEHITLADAGVTASLPANTTTMTYSYTPVDTIKAGSTGASLALSGGNATVEYVVNTPGVVFGSILRIMRSQDGNTWTPNFPDATCTVDNELKCTFQTNHLTYFGTIQVTSTPIPTSILASIGGGGTGGGGYSAPIIFNTTNNNTNTTNTSNPTNTNNTNKGASGDIPGLLLPQVFAQTQKKTLNTNKANATTNALNTSNTNKTNTTNTNTSNTINTNNTSTSNANAFTYTTPYSRTQVLFVKKYRGIYSDQFLSDVIFWSVLRNYSSKLERTETISGIISDLNRSSPQYKTIASTLKKLMDAKKR